MRLFLNCLLLAAALPLFAQNSYATLSDINRDAGWLRSSTAAAAGDFLLLYQPGGAAANQTGTNPGVVTAMNGAGHYDLNRVVRRGGDTLFLSLPLRNDYAPEHSQLIVCTATEVLTVDSAVSVPAFDGSTGGVAFLAATQRLVIAAPVSVAGAGFRGGVGTEADSDCNRFTVADGEAYGANDWRGSRRGEGIAGYPTGAPSGRAPYANGGGGGNDHNAGGGGGANIATGGIGARNLVSGLFNNSCRGNFPGRGGRAIDTGTDRIFFGGGGGAGHANNTTSASGGNGGGLVVLWAPTVRFTAEGSVNASGTQPEVVDGDGGGGGGAGGSLLIVTDSLSGSPQLTLRGGRGADVDNPGDRCFGPGGGGGGGRILIASFARAGWAPEVDLSRGGFGRRLNSTGCSPDEEPAGSGVDGNQQSILFPVPFGGFVQSADTLCTDEQLLLTDASHGANAAEWTIEPASAALQADLLGLSLRVSFADTARGTFRAVQTLFVGEQAYPGDTAVFTVYPVARAGGGLIEFDDEFVTATVINASGYDAIRYDFGDGTIVNTSATELLHTYTAGGDYTVSITLLNARCGNLPVSEGSVSLAEFAVADVTVKTAEGCAPFTLEVDDISTGVYAGSRWNLPGTTTPTLFDSTSLTVVYTEPGTYTGTLTLLGALGPDTVDQFTVVVSPTPTAALSFSVDTATATFTATTDLADNFSWNFGDGQGTATEQNPTYTYDSTGTFLVTLTAALGDCIAVVDTLVTIDVLSAVPELERRGVRLYPNPTTGRLLLSGKAELIGVRDINGRLLRRLTGRTAELGDLPPGTYVVQLRAGQRTYSQLVVRR